MLHNFVRLLCSSPDYALVLTFCMDYSNPFYMDYIVADSTLKENQMNLFWLCKVAENFLQNGEKDTGPLKEKG